LPEVRLELHAPPGRDNPVHARYVPIRGRVQSAVPFELAVRARHDEARPVVLEESPGCWRFSTLLRLPVGDHLIEITAKTASGRRSTVACMATVDPERAWQPFRRLRPEGGDAALAPLRIEGGDAMHGGLEQLAAGWQEWGLVVDAPGTLAPGAVAALIAAAERHGGADAVYGDDDGPDGPRLKPAWSPELLLQSAYAGPVALVHRRAARAVLDSGARPADVRDLLLAIGRDDARVVHLARSVFTRTGPAPSATPIATASRRADELVTAVICTAYRDGHVMRCLASLRSQAHTLEVVLVDDGTGRRGEALTLCAAHGIPVRAVTHEGRFNFSSASNLGAEYALGSELLFLNDDVVARDGPWLERMRAWLGRPGVGVVGATLVYPTGGVQHAGVVVDGRRVDNFCAGWPDETAGPLGLTRNTTAVTGACMLVERELFAALGGFDPRLAIEFSDVDLSLRAAVLGARTVCTPEAVLVHAESATRGRDNHMEDYELFMARWRTLLDAGDPFLHPALDPYREFEPLPDPRQGTPSREAPWTPGALARLEIARESAEAAAARESACVLAARVPGLELEVQAARDEAARLLSEHDRLHAGREDVWAALQSAYRSRSWRYTAPLRRGPKRSD
jgi:GT2 family glycosyltransferase